MTSCPTYPYTPAPQRMIETIRHLATEFPAGRTALQSGRVLLEVCRALICCIAARRSLSMTDIAPQATIQVHTRKTMLLVRALSCRCAHLWLLLGFRVGEGSPGGTPREV